MPSKILLIKIGALGDVVRTTSLLRALEGEVTWVTKRNAFALLQHNPLVSEIVDIEEPAALQGREYDLVINLDEEPLACDLASGVKKKDLVGAYRAADGSIAYTDSSAGWFDMGLISRFGKKAADRKKWENRSSYQEIAFAMIGRKFQGEEYVLPPDLKKGRKGKEYGVGLETRSGDRWIGKRWARFPEFMGLLQAQGVPYIKFRTFPTLEQFIRHIDKSELVVTTDSLALHIALGLKKKTVALFTCTSFHEIYDYGRMAKVVSPRIEEYFYSTDPHLKSGEAIAPDAVFQELLKLKGKKLETVPR